MPSLLSRLSEFARGPQGRALADKAKRAARDPENRKKIDQLRSKAGRKR